MTDFSELRQRGDALDEGDYVVINVSPSVVPVLQPGFRIYSYNVSGTKYTWTREEEEEEEGNRKRDKPAKCKEKRYKHSWKCRLNEEWHSDPESPSRSNKLWTPVGYAQVQPPRMDQFYDDSYFFFHLSTTCQTSIWRSQQNHPGSSWNT
jgi:endopolyphosphatase